MSQQSKYKGGCGQYHKEIKSMFRKLNAGALKMAEELAILADDRSSIPALTAHGCLSLHLPRISDNLFWPSKAPAHKDRNVLPNKNKNKCFLKRTLILSLLRCLRK